MSCSVELHIFNESLLAEFSAAAKSVRLSRWFRKPQILFPIHDWLNRNAREPADFEFSGYVVCELVDSFHEFGFAESPLAHAVVAKSIDPQSYNDTIWTHEEAQRLAAFLLQISKEKIEDFFRSGKSTLLHGDTEDELIHWMEAMKAAVKWLGNGLQSVRENEVAYLTAG